MIFNLNSIADYLQTNTENLPVVYLAGKVTGLPYKDVWLKFITKKMELEAKGFFVINPLEHVSEHEDWKKAMRISVVMLAVSDHVYLLDDWHLSTGATLERNLAMPLGINFIEG
jgi:hypothetical protein